MSTVPLRRLVSEVANGSWGAEPDEGPVTMRCIRAADFDYSKLSVSLDRAPLRSFDAATARRLALRPGDVVLEKSGGGDHLPVGRAVLWTHDVPAVPTNFAARLRAAKGVNPRFLGYALAAHFGDGATQRCIKQTTGIQNLDTEAWLATPTFLPTLTEQDRIANFLDEQVNLLNAAQIEAQRCRELLLERAKRQTRHALVGGDIFPPPLSPLPLVAARYLCRITTGSGDTQDATDDGPVPFYVRSEVPLRAHAATFDTEAVLTSGDGAGVGKIFHHVRGQFHAHQRVYVLHSFKSVSPRYFYYFFSTFFRDMALDGSAKSTVDSVRRDMIAAMPFVVPTTTAQQAVVAELDDLTRQTAEASSALENACALIDERKHALISACVTGRFDPSTASERASQAALQGVSP